MAVEKLNKITFFGKEFGVPKEHEILYIEQISEQTVVVHMKTLDTHPNAWERGKTLSVPFHCPYYEKTPAEMIAIFNAGLAEVLFFNSEKASVLQTAWFYVEKVYGKPYRLILNTILVIITLAKLVKAGAITYNENGTSDTNKEVAGAVGKNVVEKTNVFVSQNEKLFLTLYWLINSVVWLAVIYLTYGIIYG